MDLLHPDLPLGAVVRQLGQVYRANLSKVSKGLRQLVLSAGGWRCRVSYPGLPSFVAWLEKLPAAGLLESVELEVRVNLWSPELAVPLADLSVLLKVMHHLSIAPPQQLTLSPTLPISHPIELMTEAIKGVSWVHGLQRLEIQGCQLADLEPVDSMTSLRSLCCYVFSSDERQLWAPRLAGLTRLVLFAFHDMQLDLDGVPVLSRLKLVSDDLRCSIAASTPLGSLTKLGLYSSAKVTVPWDCMRGLRKLVLGYPLAPSSLPPPEECTVLSRLGMLTVTLPTPGLPLGAWLSGLTSLELRVEEPMEQGDLTQALRLLNSIESLKCLTLADRLARHTREAANNACKWAAQLQSGGDLAGLQALQVKHGAQELAAVQRRAWESAEQMLGRLVLALVLVG